MPKNATLPIVPIDHNLKKQLYKSCKTLGISYSTLITLFIKKWLNGDITLNITHIDETDFLLSTEANKKHLMESLEEEKNEKLFDVTEEDIKKML